METETLTFEQAALELETIVTQLEAGALDLDAIVALYQRGRCLVAHCQQLLDDVALRVQQLAPDAEGRLQALPFDLQHPTS